MIEIIKDNLTLLLISGYTFLVGIGIGSAITDTINTWKGTGDVKTISSVRDGET